MAGVVDMLDRFDPCALWLLTCNTQSTYHYVFSLTTQITASGLLYGINVFLKLYCLVLNALC